MTLTFRPVFLEKVIEDRQPPADSKWDLRNPEGAPCSATDGLSAPATKDLPFWSDYPTPFLSCGHLLQTAQAGSSEM